MNQLELTLARRVNHVIDVPKPTNKWGRLGLRYERTLVKALTNSNTNFLYNPQFYYETASASGYCIPDIILFHCGALIVIECKLTYKHEAEAQLLDLYCPVINAACGNGGHGAVPIIVTKNLIPTSPEPYISLEAALCTPKDTSRFPPVIHWLGRGAFPLS